MDAETTKRRLGRPTKAPTPGKKVSLGLKVTAQTKERLDQAAKESGRTQSQEAERRIEMTFDQEADTLANGILALWRKTTTLPVAGADGDPSNLEAIIKRAVANALVEAGLATRQAQSDGN